MEKLTLGEAWEKDEEKRQASLKYMQEHPSSYLTWEEQLKKNQEIRKQNMKQTQQKEENWKES